MDIISAGSVRKLKLFSSIKTKFAITYFAVVAAVLLLMNTFFLTASRDMIFSSKKAFVQNQAELIYNSLEDSFETLTADNVSRVMDALKITGVTQIIVTDTGGGVLYGSTDAGTKSEFTEAHRERVLNGYDLSYANFTEGLFTSGALTPVMRRGAAIGVVFVYDEDIEQGRILTDMQTTLRNISIIIAGFSVAVVALIVLPVLRRITSIFKAIKYVREGEYNYHINTSGNDELALLGDEFNSLTDRLRETDEVRRRFVANASHELKTPLASIRLLSDSILQNEGIGRETVQEFIGDIGTEAERLSRITEKLMTLTKLDSNVQDERMPIDLRGVAVGTLRMLQPLAASGSLEIKSELGDGCVVHATEDSIHQIIFNLVENAIKYNKPGGNVSVRLAEEDGTVVLTVDDSGVGVPDTDLPHIFDRFYRVDKARSREAGGSGLGLSIVMDTVRELDGKVTAERRAGGGMRFQVRLKAIRTCIHKNGTPL